MNREEFVRQLKVEDNKTETKQKRKHNPDGRNIVIGGAWPYANNSLHLGHIAGLISGDILARYHRQKGDNVVYVSGTDCHGTPITQRAKQEGRTPKEIAESYHREFVETFKAMNFSYDLYGKTEDEFHMEKVQEMFIRMYDNGYIYEKDDNQPYCEECEKFLSDRELKLICPCCGAESKGDQCDCGYIPTEEDLDGATCVECGNEVHLRQNKNLYLALTKLQDEIEKYALENSENWRVNAQNETKKYIREGLRDRAVTRDLDWGIDIPVEGFDDKKMYVWIDAVLGYTTMTQKYCQENGIDWEDFWKNGRNNRMYMVHGKDNITFHSIILPGLLMAMEEKFKLPDMIVSTEYLNINSEKISKSKGNGINIKDIVNEYDVDTLRFFLMANGPERKDSNFSIEDYLTTHNSEITNKYGNLANRTLNFKGLDEVPNGNMDENIDRMIQDAYQKVSDFIERTEFKKATAVIMELVEEGNKYYDERKPWEQKREDIDGFNDTIYTCINLIANLSNLFEPFMPNSSERIRKYLGIEEALWEVISVEQGTEIKGVRPLFTRVTKEKTINQNPKGER